MTTHLLVDFVEFSFDGFRVVEEVFYSGSFVGLLVLKVTLGSGEGKGLVPTQTQDGAQQTQATN